MTPKEQELHKKQAETAAELWAEGAQWHDEGSPYGPRLSITDEQYERLLQEMVDAFAKQKEETQQFRERMDKNLAELLRLRRTPWGAPAATLPGEDPENPMPAEKFHNQFGAERVQFRGFIQMQNAETGRAAVEYRDVKHAKMGGGEGAPKIVLNVEGITPEDSRASRDIRRYRAELTVYEKSQTRTIDLGTVNFTGDLAALNIENRELIGDMCFLVWLKRIEKTIQQFGGDLSGAFVQELLNYKEKELLPGLRHEALHALKTQQANPLSPNQ